MKKHLLLIASAVMLFAGCAKEHLPDVQSGENFTSTFTVVTEPASTKAVADNDGFAAKVDECLVQIWIDVDGTYKLYTKPDVTTVDNTHYTFSTTFIKNQKYKILVWADKAGYYTFADDATVTRNSTTINNTDELDAFFANVNIDAASAITNKIIYAKRPFAQLNVITTDLQSIPAEYAPQYVDIEYKAPVSMNILTEELGEDVLINVTDSPVYYAGTTGIAASSTLSMDYIFAPVEKEVRNFDYCINYTVPVGKEFNNIPLQRNYRTNIIGKMLAVDEEFIVIVDPIWETPDHDITSFMVNEVSYETIEEAFAAATPGDVLHIYESGQYDIPTSLNGFTVDATGYVVSFTTASTVTAQDMVFNNVTISAPSGLTANSGAITVKGDCEFNDCTFKFRSKFGIVAQGNVDFNACDWRCNGTGRGIMVWGGSPEINVDKCTFNCTYPFNCDAGTPVFTVTDSDLNGWTSYTNTATASFDGCTFGKSSSGYAYCRPYSNTTFSNCEFSADFLADFGAAGLTLTMDNCTQDGHPVTTFVMDPGMSNPGTLVIDGEAYELKPYAVAGDVDALKAAVAAFNAKTDAGEVDIFLAPGTYEASDMIVRQNVKDKSLKIAAMTPGSVVFKVNADSKSNMIFLIDGCANQGNPEFVQIEGIMFDFTAADPAVTSHPVYCTTTPAKGEAYASLIDGYVSSWYAHNVIIKDCELKGCGETENISLINAANGASVLHVTIDGCVVEDAGYCVNGYFNDVKIINSTVNNCKACANINNAGLTVTGCTVNTYHDYCIRTNGGPVSITDNEFDSDWNGTSTTAGMIVLRGGTDCTATISSNIFVYPTASPMYDCYCNTAWEVNGEAKAAGTGFDF